MNTESRRLVIATAVISTIAFGVGFGTGTSVDRAVAAPRGVPGPTPPPGFKFAACKTGFTKQLHPDDPTAATKYFCRVSAYCPGPFKAKKEKYNKGLKKFEYLCKK